MTCNTAMVDSILNLGALMTLLTHLERSMQRRLFPLALLATVRGFTHTKLRLSTSLTNLALTNFSTASLAQTFSSLYEPLFFSSYSCGFSHICGTYPFSITEIAKLLAPDSFQNLLCLF